MRIFLLGFVVLLSVQFADGATCESLMDLKLSNTTITIAQSVAAGAFMPPEDEADVAADRNLTLIRICLRSAGSPPH